MRKIGFTSSYSISTYLKPETLPENVFQQLEDLDASGSLDDDDHFSLSQLLYLYYSGRISNEEFLNNIKDFVDDSHAVDNFVQRREPINPDWLDPIIADFE